MSQGRTPLRSISDNSGPPSAMPIHVSLGEGPSTGARLCLPALFLVCCASYCGGQDADPARVSDPPSLRRNAEKVAFFFGLHNAEAAYEKIATSRIAKLLQDEAGEQLQEVASDAIPDPELIAGDLSLPIEIDWDDFETQIEKEALDDLEMISSQWIWKDAFLCGDQSWSESWESIAQVVLLMEQNITMIVEEDGKADIQGMEELLAAPVLKKLRIPNTLLSFALTDIKPADRLMKRISGAVETFEGQGDTPADWHLHSVGQDSLVAVSIRLTDLLDWMLQDAPPTTDDQREKLNLIKQVLVGRQLHFAMGLLNQDWIFFFGEDIRAIETLATNAQAEQHLLGTADLTITRPQNDEIHVFTAMVSDRFARSLDSLGNRGIWLRLFESIEPLGEAIKVDGVPLAQAPMALGVPITGDGGTLKRLEVAGEKLGSLKTKPAGWATTISVSDAGVIGRSVSLTADPNLPETELTVDRYIPIDAMFVHARQTTAGIDYIVTSFSALVGLGQSYMDLMLGIMMVDEDQNLGRVQLHANRLGQMPLRLSKIMNKHVGPALGDGGTAFIFDINKDLIRSGMFESELDQSPYDVAFLTSVSDADKLCEAGVMLRKWTNSLINQYYQWALSFDPDGVEEELGEIPSVPTIVRLDGGDHDLFQFGDWALNEGEATEDPPLDPDADEADVEAQPGMTSSDLHWRLSDDLLIVGGNREATQSYMQLRDAREMPWNLPGKRRRITRFQFSFFTKMLEAALKQAGSSDESDPEERQVIETAIQVLKKFGGYVSETKTHQGRTIGQWQLSVELTP